MGNKIKTTKKHIYKPILKSLGLIILSTVTTTIKITDITVFTIAGNVCGIFLFKSSLIFLLAFGIYSPYEIPQFPFIISSFSFTL